MFVQSRVAKSLTPFNSITLLEGSDSLMVQCSFGVGRVQTLSNYL